MVAITSRIRLMVAFIPIFALMATIRAYGGGRTGRSGPPAVQCSVVD